MQSRVISPNLAHSIARGQSTENSIGKPSFSTVKTTSRISVVRARSASFAPASFADSSLSGTNGRKSARVKVLFPRPARERGRRQQEGGGGDGGAWRNGQWRHGQRRRCGGGGPASCLIRWTLLLLWRFGEAERTALSNQHHTEGEACAPPLRLQLRGQAEALHRATMLHVTGAFARYARTRDTQGGLKLSAGVGTSLPSLFFTLVSQSLVGLCFAFLSIYLPSSLT